MNRTKLLIIAVIGLLLLNFGTLAILFFTKPDMPGHGGMTPHPGEGPKRIIIERLHFDEAQQKQYESLIDVHKAKNKEFHDQSADLHKELFSLLGDENPDKAKADSLIAAIAENQKGMDHLNFDHFREIKSLCKPEQLKDFNNLSSELAELFAPKGPPPPRP